MSNKPNKPGLRPGAKEFVPGGSKNIPQPPPSNNHNLSSLGSPSLPLRPGVPNVPIQQTNRPANPTASDRTSTTRFPGSISDSAPSARSPSIPTGPKSTGTPPQGSAKGASYQAIRQRSTNESGLDSGNPSSSKRPDTTSASTNLAKDHTNAKIPHVPTVTLSSQVSRPTSAEYSGRLYANHFAVTLGKYRELMCYPIKIKLLPPDKQSKKIKKEVDNHGKGKASIWATGPIIGSSQQTRGKQPAQTAANARDPYDVSKPKRQRLIHLWLQEIELNCPVATDYQSQLITTTALDGAITLTGHEVIYFDEYTSEAQRPGPKYLITLDDPKPVSLNSLFAKYEIQQPGQQPQVPLSAEDHNDAIIALNTIFSHGPYQNCFSDTEDGVSKMTTVKGQRFYGIPQKPVRKTWETLTGEVLNATGGLHIVPGFVRSVRPTLHGSIDLNIYTKTGVFWQHGTVQELIDAWDATRKPGETMHQFLSGAPVRLIHNEDGLDSFGRVEAILEEYANYANMQHPSFQSRQMVSEYYATKCDWNFSNKVWVIKVAIGKNDHFLTVPADLLVVVAGKIKPSVIPREGPKLPEDNYKRIMDTGKKIFDSADSSNPGAPAFDLALSMTMAQVPVTILGRPPLMYLNRTVRDQVYKVDMAKVKKGQWDAKGVTFVKPATSKRWTCIELHPPRPRSKCTADGINHFKEDLKKSFVEYGMANFTYLPMKESIFPNQQKEIREWAGGDKTVASLDSQYSAIKGVLQIISNTGVDFVILLLPDKDHDLYSAIKRAGDLECGIATFCHVLTYSQHALWPKSPKLPNNKPNQPQGVRNEDFLGNMCMKINLKLSEEAVNQTLTRPPTLLTRQSMLIGIDVAHAGGPRKTTPSIAAVVGSVNGDFSQFPASLGVNPIIAGTAEEPPQANEIVVNLRKLTMERLNEYYRRNNDPSCAEKIGNGIPDQIVVYRDGVSESQFEDCKTTEYNRIVAAVGDFCDHKGLDREKVPPVTMICAIKRHHTRLFRDINTKPDENLVLHDEIKDPKTNNNNSKTNNKNPNTKNNDSSKTYNNNPLPGTLAKDRITYGDGSDFFLIGHKAIAGTAIPVHYKVLQNPKKFDLDSIAQMTYDLCFLFGRSRTSVSLCTPVYYADLATKRARYYVRDFYNPPKDRTQKTRPYEEDRDGARFAQRLRVHTRLQSKMFYI